MTIQDSSGKVLKVGDRVRTVTGEDRIFSWVRTGEIAAMRSGPPAIGVQLDDERGRLFWFGDIDLMWRCPDLSSIDTQQERTGDG